MSLDTASEKAKLYLSTFFRPVLSIIGKRCLKGEAILGVDITPQCIRICELKRYSRKWKVTALASASIEDQSVNTDIHANISLYANKLRDLIKQNNIKTTNVAIAAPTSASIIKIVNLPTMEEEILKEAAAMGVIWGETVQLYEDLSEYKTWYNTIRTDIKPSESFSTNDAFSYYDEEESVSEEETSVEMQPGTEFPFARKEGGDEKPTMADLQNLLNADLPDASEGEPDQNDQTSEDNNSEEQNNIEANSVEEEIEEEANTMDILFAASSAADINIYDQIIMKAGLTPVYIDIRCNSIRRALDTNKDTPYAILEFGADDNYIFIISGERASTFFIDITDEDRQLIASNSTTAVEFEEIAKRYAENLKYLIENYIENDDQAIKPENIYINSVVPIYNDEVSDKTIIDIFINRLSEEIPKYTFLPNTLCKKLDIPRKLVKHANDNDDLANWAAAIGLATCKLDAFCVDKSNSAIGKINLLPNAEETKNIVVKEKVSTFAMVMIFILVFSGAIGSFVFLSRSNYIIANKIKALHTVKQQHSDRKNELKRLIMVLDQVRSLDKTKLLLASNQTNILAAYKDLAVSIPQGVWINSLNFSDKSTLEIRGKSITHAKLLDFIDNLNRSSAIEKVALKTMEAATNDSTKKLKRRTAQKSLKKFVLDGFIPKTIQKANDIELVQTGGK